MQITLNLTLPEFLRILPHLSPDTTAAEALTPEAPAAPAPDPIPEAPAAPAAPEAIATPTKADTDAVIAALNAGQVDLAQWPTIFKVFMAKLTSGNAKAKAARRERADKAKANGRWWWLLAPKANAGEKVLLHPLKGDEAEIVLATWRTLSDDVAEAPAPEAPAPEAPAPEAPAPEAPAPEAPAPEAPAPEAPAPEPTPTARVNRPDKQAQFIAWLTAPTQAKGANDAARDVLNKKKYTAAASRAALDPTLVLLADLTDAEWSEVYAEINAALGS